MQLMSRHATNVCISCMTWLASHVTCHMWHVTCHMWNKNGAMATCACVCICMLKRESRWRVIRDHESFHTATHCSTLQHMAIPICDMNHFTCNSKRGSHAADEPFIIMRPFTLQHTAKHCNTLQHKAIQICGISYETVKEGVPLISHS